MKKEGFYDSSPKVRNGIGQDVYHVNKLIFVPTGRLLGGLASQMRPWSETSAAMFYLCESEATATTKRSAGTEINPTLW
ncbi:hypothetical protein AN161_01875 [Lysinibacillus sp. FJAT-14222]|nr:hypothetical protein AN161_01875 [Lysinibacillus sp. FJAT-14222]